MHAAINTNDITKNNVINNFFIVLVLYYFYHLNKAYKKKYDCSALDLYDEWEFFDEIADELEEIEKKNRKKVLVVWQRFEGEMFVTIAKDSIEIEKQLVDAIKDEYQCAPYYMFYWNSVNWVGTPTDYEIKAEVYLWGYDIHGDKAKRKI